VERLWTPWRREFIESATGDRSDANDGCFLCPGPDTADDARRLIVYRSTAAFVILNLYPYNSGHLMVAPFAHTGDFANLEPGIATDLMLTAQRAVAALERVYHPDAFNVGMNLGKAAGAGVPDHLHMHVVPRWNGDTNFMPVLAETKVLPETLQQTYARLYPAFHD
jgi:ATP adenylyltransferase